MSKCAQEGEGTVGSLAQGLVLVEHIELDQVEESNPSLLCGEQEHHLTWTFSVSLKGTLTPPQTPQTQL